MRILVRTSKWAIWSRRLGSFGLPLVLVPVLMYRGGAIDTLSFEAVEGLAIVVALFAVLAGLAAFARIWFTGDLGWGLALTGLLLGLVCLSPIGYFAYAYHALPMANDVSTDEANPPALVTAALPPFIGRDEPDQLAAAFAGLGDRNYPVAARRVFDIADQLTGEQGWQVVLHRAPTTGDPNGEINAIATTLFGFRDEIALRLTAMDDGSTTVSMRSVSLTTLHEPGANGRRVQDFLAALDDRITQLQQDQPAGVTEDDDAAPAPLPAPAPTRGKRH